MSASRVVIAGVVSRGLLTIGPGVFAQDLDQPKAASETPSSVDVRDRLDSPPAAPPPEKPKKKSGWNSFGRE